MIGQTDEEWCEELQAALPVLFPNGFTHEHIVVSDGYYLLLRGRQDFEWFLTGSGTAWTCYYGPVTYGGGRFHDGHDPYAIVPDDLWGVLTDYLLTLHHIS